MYSLIYDHYYDYEEYTDDCFICLEKYDDKYKEYPIKLNNTQKYIKICSCDGWIHRNCLDKWVNTKSSCPICKNLLEKKNYEIRVGSMNINVKNNLYLKILLLIIRLSFIYFFIIFGSLYLLDQIDIIILNKNFDYDYYYYYYSYYGYYGYDFNHNPYNNNKTCFTGYQSYLCENNYYSYNCGYNNINN